MLKRLICFLRGGHLRRTYYDEDSNSLTTFCTRCGSHLWATPPLPD
jgi:hypothetical protein